MRLCACNKVKAYKRLGMIKKEKFFLSSQLRLLVSRGNLFKCIYPIHGLIKTCKHMNSGKMKQH